VPLRNDESTKLKSAVLPGAASSHRIIAFWAGGSATYELPHGATLIVGRADDCGSRLPDDSVSRHHAAVHGGPEPRIEDLGSANGTVVAGRRLEPHSAVPLPPSAVAELGDALLVLRAVYGDQPVRQSTVPPARLGGLDHRMDRFNEQIELVASATIPVLLLGETGVGKGLIAEAIHRRSPRAARPFVRLNCAALADALLESELFGHERGAFTGAMQAKPGLLEAASTGTILLDEIGDMPHATQAKVLHVLEHNEVLRVGSIKPRPIDVRFLTATNRDLQMLVAQGRFRQDLFFRINGVTLRVPPLRERPADIESLARSFVDEASAQLARSPPTVTDEAMRLLLSYAWPGNVRELRNAMVRATLFAQGERIGSEHFELAPPMGVGGSSAGLAALGPQVRDLEKQRIVEALDRCGNNQVETAKALGISRGTLRTRMREFGLLRAREKR
jgi:transcriptional regulator with PAS, ATPase and Fis domain